jgi:hypothetical protein
MRTRRLLLRFTPFAGQEDYLRIKEMDEAIATSEDITTVPNSPETSTLCDNKEVEEGMEDVGLIGELHPLNQAAKYAFYRLAARRYDIFFTNTIAILSELIQLRTQN